MLTPSSGTAQRVFTFALLFVALLAGMAAPASAAETIDGVFDGNDNLSGAYRLIIPSGASEDDPVGLIVFFHSDGVVGSVKSDANALAARGNESHLAVAALVVPWEGGGSGEPPSDPADQCWWAPRVQQNALYVKRWIEQVVDDELGDALDRDRIYFVGVSGGADLAAALNVHLGFLYGGGSVAVCGGDLPRSDGGSCFGPDPPVLDPLPGVNDVSNGDADAWLYSFDTTLADPFRPLAIDASEYYSDLGFSVSFADLPGGGHCQFNEEGVFGIIDRRLEEMLGSRPGGGCQLVDVREFADDLIDQIPLQVAQIAIPLDDPKRSKLLGKIQKRLDRIAALRTEIPDQVYECGGNSGCPKVGLGPILDQILDDLRHLKNKLVPKVVGRSSDAELREGLLEQNLISHKAKKKALKQIPRKGRLCEL